MNTSRRSRIAFVCGVSSMGLAAALVVSAFVVAVIAWTRPAPTEGAAAQQEPPPPAALGDLGAFRVGAALGEERAAFSGFAKLTVFLDPASAERDFVEACLSDAAIAADLVAFTPILVDASATDDAAVEATLRTQGFQIVIRRMSGEFLGGLMVGFDCAELIDLLRAVRAGDSKPPARDELYRILLADPPSIDAVVAGAGFERAHLAYELLREFEGAESSIVQAVGARLGR